MWPGSHIRISRITLVQSFPFLIEENDDADENSQCPTEVLLELVCQSFPFLIEQNDDVEENSECPTGVLL